MKNRRCAEDLSSVLKITYPTCYEADPNALYPSRQRKGKRLNYEIQRDNKNAATKISQGWN